MSKRITYRSVEELEALRDGVEQHGAGNWHAILSDSELAPFFQNRTTTQLQTKWRHILAWQWGSGGNTDDSMTPTSEAQIISSFGSTNSNIPDYDTMIIEALEFPEDPRGSQINTIAALIKQRHEVPENMTELLDPELMRLVHENRLDKDKEDFYRINILYPF